MGIRRKAAALLIVLILLPSLFVLAVNYSIRESVSEDTMQMTEDILIDQTLNSTVSLNKNASLCMQNYLNSIELSAESASLEVSKAIGGTYHGSHFVWTSKYLLTQVNHTMVRGIMNGTIPDSHYDSMVNMAGRETVDDALRYLVNTPSLNYSDPHVNGSAYDAINKLGRTLFEKGSLEIYDFLYSVLLPRYRAELDSLFPVADTLYSFRNMPDLLWSYYADDSSGFSILIPSGTYLSPLFNAAVRPWYQKAQTMGEHPWSHVYVDELTGNPVATYSVPVRKDGRFSGVVGFDLLLTTLTERTREFYVSNTSFAFVIADDGTALAYPDQSLLGKNLSVGDSDFNMSIREIMGNSSGTVETVMEGRDVTLIFSSMESTGWKFVNVLDMQELKDKAEKISHCAGSEVSNGMIYMMIIQISVGILIFIIAFIAMDAHIRRIERLTRYSNEVSMGNFDVEDIEPSSDDEMGDLERSFKRMINSLKVALRELERGEK